MASNVSVLMTSLRRVAANRARRKPAAPIIDPVPTKAARGLGPFAVSGIVLLLLANGWEIYRLQAVIADFLAHPDSRWEDLGLFWALPALLGMSALNLTGLGLLFARQKSGLFLLLLGTVSGVAVTVAIGLPGRFMVPAIIGSPVLALVLLPRWSRLR